LEGLKGEDSIAAICRREGIAPSLYYKWSKTFLQAGKRRLDGDTMREANSDEVGELRKENDQLKQLVAELSLKNYQADAFGAEHQSQYFLQVVSAVSARRF
jgi:transposase